MSKLVGFRRIVPCGNWGLPVTTIKAFCRTWGKRFSSSVPSLPPLGLDQKMKSLGRLLLLFSLPLFSAASPLSSASKNSYKFHYKVDPKCPSGTTPGFEVYTARYDVPAKKFYEKVGSFFDETWYVSMKT